MFCAVTHPAASLARKATTAAISAGWPSRPKALNASRLATVRAGRPAGHPGRDRRSSARAATGRRRRDVAGLPGPEVSELLAISEASRWALLHHGRSRIRQALEQQVREDVR